MNRLELLQDCHLVNCRPGRELYLEVLTAAPGVDLITLILVPCFLVTLLTTSWHRVRCIPNMAHYPEPEPDTCAMQALLT